MPSERSPNPMWQALSDVKKAEASQELRDGYSLEEKAGEITVLRDLIAELPQTFLLNLGSEKEVKAAKKPNSPRQHYARLEQNLRSVVLAAFPTCQILENDSQRTIGGRRFKGPYIDGLYLSLE